MSEHANDTWPEGRTITEVRPMTVSELDALDWWRIVRDSGERPTVIVLDDGSTLYPADADKNRPGELHCAKGGIVGRAIYATALSHVTGPPTSDNVDRFAQYESSVEHDPAGSEA